MANKRLYILIISAVFLTVLSLIILMVRSSFMSSYSKEIGETALPFFAESDIKEIKLIKPGGRSVNLVRNQDSHWTIGNYFNYPADKEKINTLLQELTSLKVVQTVNIDKNQLRALKLLPPSEKDKETGTEIRIIGHDNQIIYSLIAGQKRIDSFGSAKITKGRYILLSSFKSPFLCEENFTETKYSAKEFLNSDFVIIKDIKKLQLFKSGSSLWTIIKKNQNDEFELIDKKSEDPDINIDNVYSIISSLESLKFDSVANPTMSADSTGLDKPYILKIETFSGGTFTLEIGKQFSNYYFVKIEAQSFREAKKWIYLIDNSRIAPLIQIAKI